MHARENLTRSHPRTEALVAHHWEVLCRASTDLYNACSRHQTELVDRLQVTSDTGTAIEIETSRDDYVAALLNALGMRLSDLVDAAMARIHTLDDVPDLETAGEATEDIAERIDAAIGVLSRRDVSAPTLIRTRETT